jgi:dTDP-4-dehydrorhamnose 3,5-epimerase-like enzyme
MDIVVKLSAQKQECFEEEKYFQSIVLAKQHVFDIVDVFLVNTRAIRDARNFVEEFFASEKAATQMKLNEACVEIEKF